VLGKVLGGTTLAVLQAMVFLALAPLVGITVTPLIGFTLLGTMTLVAFGLTAFGVALAWRCESVQGYHAMMNVLLFPMWLLSGALFPPSGAEGWVRGIMQANPLSYGLALVRRVLEPETAAGLPSVWLCLGVTLGFGLVAYLAAWMLANRQETRPIA